MSTLTYAQAINLALRVSMAEDDSLVVMGQGVTTGDMYGTLAGLAKLSPHRVIETPLSEDGMTGIAIGMAMAGTPVIQTHIRMDFALLAMNQLINAAAKLPYMSDGQVQVPLVVRVVVGRGWGQGAQHSQSLQSLFAHIPGINVAMPSTPYTAHRALRKAIKSREPTIFIEHRMLYDTTGIVGPEYDLMPRPWLLREGSDLTLVGISHMAVECLRAADALEEQAGLSVQVISPTWLSPLEDYAIIESVRDTLNLHVVDSSHIPYGTSAEIITRVAEAQPIIHCGWIGRSGNAYHPCPTARELEEQFYPSATSIAQRVSRGMLDPKYWNIEVPDDPNTTEFKGPF
jgi:pyruvate dehydrogenase E1 component beta subunit